tara:strand:+ start:1519 stop:2208 length:690 start_codon:yes stop_codon:yes gene_type:complete
MKLKYRAGGGFTRSSGSFKPTGNQMTIGTGTSRSFRAGGALSAMAKRYAVGGRPSITDPKKESGNGNGNGNGAGQPAIVLQDTRDVESLVRQGLASSATPGGGAKVALGEGSPVEFESVLQSFREKNPDLVNPKRGYAMVGDERVFYDKGDWKAHQRDVVESAHDKGVGHTQGSRYDDIYAGLMDEFDNYIASFGDEIKNDPKAIERMREKYREQAASYADQIDAAQWD